MRASRSRRPSRPLGPRGGPQRLRSRRRVVVVRARGRCRSRRPARSRPPRRPSPTVVVLMPPSTWMSMSRPRRSISARSARIFGTTSLDELLPREARVDGHHAAPCAGRRARAARRRSASRAGARPRPSSRARGCARRSSRRSGTASACTLMRSAPARANVLDEAIRLDDHQVQIERHLRRPAERLHDVRADGEVRDELTVHHVDVNQVGAGRLDRLHLLAQAREIGGQDRRRDTEGALH